MKKMAAETSNARGEWVLERLRGVLEHGKMGDKCLIAPDLVAAAIASLSAPQPPAEAQPVEKGRGVSGRDMYDVDDFLARANPPPSTPVEAEAERTFYAQDFYEEAREGKKPWPAQQPAPSAPDGAVHDALQRDIDARGFAEIRQAELDALTRSAPSAPVGAAEDMVLDAIERRESSAPVGVDAIRIADDLETWVNDPFVTLTPMRKMDVEDFVRRIRALAQQPAADPGACPACKRAWSEHRIGYSASACKMKQPAAVDGVLQRAAEALLTARSQIGACRPDDDDEDDQAWWDELTELAAALAGQQGGSTNE